MIPKELYYATSYFEKWICGLALVLTEKGFVKQEDLDSFFGNGRPKTAPQYRVGQTVRVRGEDTEIRWRKPHIRTPGYIFGCTGVVERVMQPNKLADGWIPPESVYPKKNYAWFKSPLLASFGNESEGAQRNLYRVRFKHRDVWPEAFSACSEDTIDVELFEDWLAVPGMERDPEALPKPPSYADSAPIVWDGQWRFVKSRAQCEKDAVRQEHNKYGPLRDFAENFCLMLIQQKLIKLPGPMPGMSVYPSEKDFRDSIPQAWATFQPWPSKLGCYIIARAWYDKAFMQLLLNDGNQAAFTAYKELTKDNPKALPAFAGAQGFSTKLVVHANTATDHNVFVCTLCSCYPTLILGQAPAYFKSIGYRAQLVRNPRGVLANTFGLRLPSGCKVHVTDSNAECRYMILPMRPEHTEGWPVSELEKLVTRNSMIGTGWPLAAEQKPTVPWPQSQRLGASGQPPYLNGYLVPGRRAKSPYPSMGDVLC